MAVEAQQAMNRARLVADDFLEALGGLASGRGQHDLQFQSLGDAGNGRYRVCFAATGAAGHQRDGEPESVPDSIALLGIQFAALSVEKMLYLRDSVRAALAGGLAGLRRVPSPSGGSPDRPPPAARTAARRAAPRQSVLRDAPRSPRGCRACPSPAACWRGQADPRIPPSSRHHRARPARCSEARRESAMADPSAFPSCGRSCRPV